MIYLKRDIKKGKMTCLWGKNRETGGRKKNLNFRYTLRNIYCCACRLPTGGEKKNLFLKEKLKESIRSSPNPV